MRDIQVSTEVFALIWSLRKSGEESEDAILSRVLGQSKVEEQDTVSFSPKSSAETSQGIYDSRHDVHFKEGFEIFRNYLGADYRAKVSGGSWLLLNDGSSYPSLNQLSRRIGAKSENAWINWFFLSEGNKVSVDSLRSIKVPEEKNSVIRNKNADEIKMNSDGTWRDDVRIALVALGGRASLNKIYNEVEKIRMEAGRSVPRTLQATIRRTLEDHSSDSQNYRGTFDLFFMPEGKGEGIWALRSSSSVG